MSICYTMWAVLFLSQYSSTHWPVPCWVEWKCFVGSVLAQMGWKRLTPAIFFCNSKYMEDLGRKRDVKGSWVRCVNGSAGGNSWKNSWEERERQWGRHRFWELWRCCIFNSRPLCSNLCLIDSLPLKSSRQSPAPQVVPPWKLLRPQRSQTKCKGSRHNVFAVTT